MDIKQESLLSAYEYIEKLHEGIKRAILYGKDNRIDELRLLTAEIIDGLNWFSDVITLTQDIYVESINMDTFKASLDEIYLSLKNEDYILLIDTYEYELLGLLEDWYNKIQITLNYLHEKGEQ